ncbi:MAG: hypothetical protein AB8G95_20795 [Anaerolineae bacterium]
MSDQNQSKDTGRDCPYCGGVIYRIENESGEVKTAFHNCNMCGARWSDSWSLTSPGNRGYTHDIGRTPRKKASGSYKRPSFNWQTLDIPKWAWVVIVILGAFALVALGALPIIRLLLWPLSVVFLGFIVFFYGRERRWW